MVYYSGFPGAKDYSHYAATLTSAPSAVPLSDPGNNTAYGPNLYVNMGLEYHPSKNWTFRVDAYNLESLVDPKLSKVNYILRESEYNEQPAAVAFMIRYTF
jgi:hypothetical protein